METISEANYMTREISKSICHNVSEQLRNCPKKIQQLNQILKEAVQNGLYKRPADSMQHNVKVTVSKI